MPNGPKPPTPDESSAELDRERLGWRERMLGGVAWSIFCGASLTTAWYATFDRYAPQLMPFLLGLMAASGAAALLRRLELRVRATLVLGSLFVTGTYGIMQSGFSPNAVLGLAVVSVVGALLLGRTTGLATAVGGSATLFLVAWGHQSGVLTRTALWTASVDSASLANAVRVSGIFLLLCGTMVVGVSFLLSRTERLALEKAQSLATLEAEQAAKERIARDLELGEATFRKAQELEILGRLAGSMAHDFNNSLVVIWSALEELKFLGPLPKAMEPAIEAMRAAAEQAASTTKQLRAFGPTTLQKPAPLALGPVLTKTKTMLGRVLPQNLELRAEVERDATITADEGEVLRVITNLALNARDAMRDGGKLTLRLRAPRDGEPTTAKDGSAYAVLEVADTGTGMSDEVKARMFEPYFTTKQASGTGLGLASVRELLERAGGEVRVDSELGRGTSISLFWPLAPPQAQPAGITPGAASTRPLVVLLVDDEAAVRNAIGKGLLRAGMTVLEAADGASALVLARRHHEKIDVLCTDCVMAGVPVAQLIERFRDLHQGKVVVCSAYAPAESRLSPEMFDDFVSKPFHADELTARIRALAG